MQMIHGDLVDNTVLVKKPKDVGRLFTKSRFGKTRSGNILDLSLLEAVFLAGEQKLQVYKDKTMVSFADLVLQATNEIPRFELLYIAYRDLRKRGHFVTLFPHESPLSFQINAEKNHNDTPVVFVCSEQDVFDINQLIELYKIRKQESLWIALIDEEGDITYYLGELMDLQGSIASIQYPMGTAILLDNRTVVFDDALVQQLHKREFFGKPFGDGLQLSLVETLYLVEIGVLQVVQPGKKKPLSRKKIIDLFTRIQPDIIDRLQVFQDLKQRKLLVKTGFKFGTHFRVYTQNPNAIHAEYLVHVVPSSFTGSWAEISRGIRLAHTVNKEFLFASFSGKNVDYFSLGRLRP